MQMQELQEESSSAEVFGLQIPFHKEHVDMHNLFPGMIPEEEMIAGRKIVKLILK